MPRRIWRARLGLARREVRNRPVYVAMGITIDGERDVLGLWAGPVGGGEGAKQWMTMLTELRNRGVADVCIVCCDGLKGLPDAISGDLAAGHGSDLRGAFGARARWCFLR